jgi:hypothetical protein
MIQEQTITICGKEVRMRYCAAAETTFESISAKKIEVFLPLPSEFDADGTPTAYKPSEATAQDYITLAVSAIIAAYARAKEEPPVTVDDILYDATPQEVTDLVTMVAKLRLEWYKVPEVVKPDIKPDGKPKNAQPPTTSSKK